jgi:hypothetical protein
MAARVAARASMLGGLRHGKNRHELQHEIQAHQGAATLPSPEEIRTLQESIPNNFAAIKDLVPAGIMVYQEAWPGKNGSHGPDEANPNGFHWEQLNTTTQKERIQSGLFGPLERPCADSEKQRMCTRAFYQWVKSARCPAGSDQNKCISERVYDLKNSVTTLTGSDTAPLQQAPKKTALLRKYVSSLVGLGD